MTEPPQAPDWHAAGSCTGGSEWPSIPEPVLVMTSVPGHSEVNHSDRSTKKVNLLHRRKALPGHSRSALGLSSFAMGLLSWFQRDAEASDAAPQQSAGGCPVMHSSKPPATGSEGASACPVPHSLRQHHPMILLDPRNNMQAGGESQ